MCRIHMETGPRRVEEAIAGTAQIRCGKGMTPACQWGPASSRFCEVVSRVRGVESSIKDCKASRIKCATHRVNLGRYPREFDAPCKLPRNEVWVATQRSLGSCLQITAQSGIRIYFTTSCEHYKNGLTKAPNSLDHPKTTSTASSFAAKKIVSSL